jgi:6-phosphogluconate dehydrogenase (decarboxylating)
MPITEQCQKKAVRFTKDYQPKNKHTGPYLTTILKKLLETEIYSSDPEVKRALKDTKLKGTKGVGLMLRLIHNGLEGETNAIREILDRIDGKEPDTEINVYTQMWQGACVKSEKVDNSGRLTPA